MSHAPRPEDSAVTLWWFPVGIDHPLSAAGSSAWERAVARREHRMPVPLHHAALEVHDDDGGHVVEMAPAWGAGSHGRGVAATGPVAGLRRIGVRYEVRCGRGPIDADRAALASARIPLPLNTFAADLLRERVERTPLLPWGCRTGGRTATGGDMWNSNAFVAWLLQPFLPSVADLAPPAPGRAPGWATGIAVAADPVIRAAAAAAASRSSHRGRRR